MRTEGERRNEQQRRYLRNMAIICPVVVTVGLIDAVLPTALSPINFAASLFRMWACMLPIAVPFFLFHERRLRSGESLHCPACDYEFAYGADATQLHPERCPECGTEWRDKWVKGRRGGSSIRLKVFVVCGIVGLLVAGVNASRSRSFGMRFTPTWLLLRHVQQAEDVRSYKVDDLWNELAKRPLDSVQESTLVDRIINSLRLRPRGGTSRAMEAWFSGVLSSGRVPASTIARYLRERVTASLDIEPSAQGGFDAVLRVIDHDDDGFGDLTMVLDRCWLEPSGTDLAMQDGWYGAAYMADNAPESRDTTLMALPGIADTNPSFRVPLPDSDAARPQGRKRVRATVWVFWSSARMTMSRMAPEDLVADPTLDLTVRLLDTIELEAEIPVAGP